MAADHPIDQPSLWGDDESGKRCGRCTQYKLLREFYLRRLKSGKRIRMSICKECSGKALIKWQKANRERRKVTQRRQRFRKLGLTLAGYATMKEEQNNLCAICRQPGRPWRGRQSCEPLHVDHDHKTGKVRGLLCEDCNLMLGKAHDDPRVLRAGADYLEANYPPGRGKG